MNRTWTSTCKLCLYVKNEVDFVRSLYFHTVCYMVAWLGCNPSDGKRENRKGRTGRGNTECCDPFTVGDSLVTNEWIWPQQEAKTLTALKVFETRFLTFPVTFFTWRNGQLSVQPTGPAPVGTTHPATTLKILSEATAQRLISFVSHYTKHTVVSSSSIFFLPVFKNWK